MFSKDDTWLLHLNLRLNLPLSPHLLKILPWLLTWRTPLFGCLTQPEKLLVKKPTCIFRTPPNHPFWAKHIWSKFIPPSRSTLMWCILRDRLPIEEHLGIVGYSLPSRCFLCKTDVDSTTHILLHCTCAKAVWDSMSNTFCVSLDTSGNFLEFFRKAVASKFCNQLLNQWKVAIISRVYATWYAQKQSIFEDHFVLISRTLSKV